MSFHMSSLSFAVLRSQALIDFIHYTMKKLSSSMEKSNQSMSLCNFFKKEKSRPQQRTAFPSIVRNYFNSSIFSLNSSTAVSTLLCIPAHSEEMLVVLVSTSVKKLLEPCMEVSSQ